MVDEALTIDLDAISESLTFEDMEILEEMSGVPIGDFPVFGGNATVTAKMLKALVYVAMRHSDPNTTVEDVSSMKLSTLANSPLGEEKASETGTSDVISLENREKKGSNSSTKRTKPRG